MSRILLVDDDAELSAMLAQYLQSEGFSVTPALNGEEGVKAALSESFDAIILDIMMPRLNGIEVLRLIRKTSSVPVIMLTAKGDKVERVVGLELGADDYIAKPYYPRELVARLRAVLRRTPGSGAVMSEQLVFGQLVLNPSRHELVWKGQPIEMTASEFNMVEMLMKQVEAVTTKDTLSLNVLGRTREVYDRSVDVHISKVRQKLEVATNGEVGVETIRGIGYRMSRRS